MDKLAQNAQNVISMSDYQPDTGYAALSQIEAYWEALRGNRLMPNRSEIDPRGIEQSLEYAFILERVAPGIARMRIAGSHLRALMGMEVRGMPLTTFFVPAARRTVSEALENVFQLPGQCTLHLTAQGSAGRPPLEGRMLLLPLKSDLGDVSRAIGCLVCPGEIGHAPRRFDVAKQDMRSSLINPATTHLPTATPPKLGFSTQPPEMPGLAKSAATYKGEAGKRRPPYLRLIKSEE